MLLRDAMLPCIWAGGLVGNEFVWRGTAMDIGEPAEPASGSLQLAEE
jgi:hypothetical protein